MKTKAMLAILLTALMVVAGLPTGAQDLLLESPADLVLTEEEAITISDEVLEEILLSEDVLQETPEQTEDQLLEEEPQETILILPEELPEEGEVVLSDMFSDGGSEGGLAATPTPTPDATPTPQPIVPTPTPDGLPSVAEILGLDRAPYLPPAGNPADGFQVQGLSQPIDFPEGTAVPFTVTGASAATLFGKDLVQADCRWSPVYWTLDGYSTKNNLAADTSIPVDTASMTLQTDMSQFHESGLHHIRIYFRLFTWLDEKWTPYKEIYTYVVVPYTVKGEALTPTPTPVPTEIPSLSATPTPTPATPAPTIRDAYIPEVSSPDDGFLVEGLEEPIELAADVPHSFTVTGASAQNTHGDTLVIGDGKWSPEYWMGNDSDGKQNYDESDTSVHTTKTWTVRSKTGIYNSSETFTITLYFRLFLWNGSGWVRTSTLDTVMVPVVAAKITPIPTAPTGTIKLNVTKTTLYKDSAKAYRRVTLEPTLTGDLVGKTVKYASSDESIATVSAKGVVTAVSKGKATITASVKISGKTFKATCKITVKNPTLTLSMTELVLNVGDKYSLSAVAKPEAKLDFSSTDKTIATVNSKGIVTAKAPGECYIVISANNLPKSCKITVR